MSRQPLCFVLMPFGQKPDGQGGTIDFDAVYADLIKPAVAAAGLDPLRADEEVAGGIIHKPMFERLILCPFAVADLTTANANVFYELGVRHAVRPQTTVLVMSTSTRLPFDVTHLRAMPYHLTPGGSPDRVAESREAVTRRLIEAKESVDSPLFQLVEGFQPPPLDHLKTDVFRERVDYSARVKVDLAAARKTGRDAVAAIEAAQQPLDRAESGIIVDLFLSYRAVKAWDDMVALAGKMPRPLAETTMVQEQLALALNRAGSGEEAEGVLLALLERRGPSSETYGILGRVYKDRYDAALLSNQPLAARGFLSHAIDAYLKGFESDWRDAYPGVNAVTLMELRLPEPDPRGARLLPIVRYAVDRKMAMGKPDYWDYATLLELDVLASQQDASFESLANALARVRETWEPETTARNLRLIRAARAARGIDTAWIGQLEQELTLRAKG
jgi:hypothetical protein